MYRLSRREFLRMGAAGLTALAISEIPILGTSHSQEAEPPGFDADYFTPYGKKKLELGDRFIYVKLDETKLALVSHDELTDRYYPELEYLVTIGDDRYEEFETPTGDFMIQEIIMKPDWIVPRNGKKYKGWVKPEHIAAAEEHGGIIPYGHPLNPMGKCKIRLVDYNTGAVQEFLIHGNAGSTAGSRASHSCVRMIDDNILELTKYIKKGTFVLIRDVYPFIKAPEPVKEIPKEMPKKPEYRKQEQDMQEQEEQEQDIYESFNHDDD